MMASICGHFQRVTCVSDYFCPLIQQLRKPLWCINPRPTPLKPCAFHGLVKHTLTLLIHTQNLSLTSPILCHSSCDIHIPHVNTDAISLLHDVIMAADAHIQ